MEEYKSNNAVLVAGIVILSLCVCVLAGGMTSYGNSLLKQPVSIVSVPTITSRIETPNGAPTDVVSTLIHPSSESVFNETMQTLEAANVPISDPLDLACRLQDNCNIPEVVSETAVMRAAGDTGKFWVHNLDTNVNVQVDATLQYLTPHVYFWVQDGVKFKNVDLRALVDTFESLIYPTDRAFFGSEWSPGIDGDVHIYILYTRGLGSSIAGYFSSTDSINPLVQKYSNGHEMFFFNADNTNLSDNFTYSVLAHEFQHMIHWRLDRNETSWLNEGSSELASFINGYDPGGFDWVYINNTDVQLNDWPNDNGSTIPHYGAAFLFLDYFLNRFGEDATKLLVKDPANGLESVDDVLKQINATDALTKQPITADNFFMDWAATNFLLDKSVGDGRYFYDNYRSAHRASATEDITACPQPPLARDVYQYGVDYISIICAGEHIISFTGSTLTHLLPVEPYSGKYAFWSNKGDSSDMTLTREFDFTNVSAPIELSYHTWYDIEKDWDYVYLETSLDGRTWNILTTPSGTGTDPSGNSYGWGYTGVSNDWIQEKVDLSNYAGKKVFIRFEYITDAAVNGEGFLLDDVQVEGAGYRSDFEADDGGWQADGFVRIQNALPQTFGLALIKSSDSSVSLIPLNADQTAQVSLSLKPGEKAYLVISGFNRYTREKAGYQLEIR